jgi:hypothetical protein
MPDPWMPGAVRDPGALAGYARGTNNMQFSVCHFTAGTHSEGIGKQGLFTILFPKVGPPIQYAEINALVWHAGVSPNGTYWNPYGPGAEWERLTADEPLTDDQYNWGAQWLNFNETWGVPKIHYHGPRYYPGDFRGFINHRDLCSDRSDGLSDAEWDHMVALSGGGAWPPAALTPEEEEGMLIWKRGTADLAILFGNHRPRRITSVNDWHGPYLVCDPEAFDQYFQDAIDIFNAAVK